MALRAGKYKHLFPQNEKTIDNSRKDADIFVQKPLFGNNMKKENVKVLHTGAPLVARQEKNGGRTAIALEIRNMRRGDNGCLTPVGKYEQVEKSDGSWMPLGHIGGRLIAASGTSVKAVAVDGSGAAPLSADTSLPGPALCAVPSSDDSLTVMTADNPSLAIFSYDNPRRHRQHARHSRRRRPHSQPQLHIRPSRQRRRPQCNRRHHGRIYAHIGRIRGCRTLHPARAGKIQATRPIGTTAVYLRSGTALPHRRRTMLRRHRNLLRRPKHT